MLTPTGDNHGSSWASKNQTNELNKKVNKWISLWGNLNLLLANNKGTDQTVHPRSMISKLGDNCIQHFHLGRYIVGLTVGNLVLQWQANMVIPILMGFYSLDSNWSVASCIKPHKCVGHQMKCDVINGIKLFPTVYRRIYTVANF